MKHPTKFIIQESRLEKLVSKYLNEFGLSKTSQMMGISRSKVLELAKAPIDSPYAYEILYEKMMRNELKKNYEEFEIRTSINGVFYWESVMKTGHFGEDMTEQISVAATPFWDGAKYTPVEIDWFTLMDKNANIIYDSGGDGNFFKEVKNKTQFESVEQLLNWYDKFYLPEVYDVIMNTLLPKVHKLVDYELKLKG
jgi:hypothetical protein